MSIDVGGDFIHVPSSFFNTPSMRETIIDSGTTLAYFPDKVYNQLMEKVSGIVRYFLKTVFYPLL